ncbi:hypothetical protein AMECASPLE_032514 [Ameca splendens]|uniref:Secreted protein n=1 Tax=Ameca splendens TaxID=208324 RepID=A0ABV1A206_9TELE
MLFTCSLHVVYVCFMCCLRVVYVSALWTSGHSLYTELILQQVQVRSRFSLLLSRPPILLLPTASLHTGDTTSLMDAVTSLAKSGDAGAASACPPTCLSLEARWEEAEET